MLKISLLRCLTAVAELRNSSAFSRFESISYLASDLSSATGLRQGSHLGATTSSSSASAASGSGHGFAAESSGLVPPSCARGYNTWRYPKRIFKLPPRVKKLIKAKIAAKPLIPPYVPAEAVPRAITSTSRRVGCIAVKAGMTQTWDAYGARVPLTVLMVDDCQVVGIKYPEMHGYWGLQLGAGHRKQKSISPSEAGFFLKQGVPLKHEVTEFAVSEDAILPVGTSISAAHFVAGQKIDVTGHTKYKSFQGVMKRWGFKGMPATHGVTLSHRAPGSIGARTDPGRVWKGKKMPGHMGDAQRTVHNCLIYKVDPQRNLVYLRGQIPGPAGEFVHLRDAISIQQSEKATWGLPFPTYLGDLATLPPTVYATPKDPYRRYAEEADYFPIEWKKGGE